MDRMKMLLKRRIFKITRHLKDVGKLRLAACIEKNWHKTVLEYSKELNHWQPYDPMEKEMKQAFGQELERLEITGVFKTEILESLNKRRILQTTPHLGATEMPRFFCLNWLGSLGVPKDEYYVVAMYSGIPLSNHTRPGRINRKFESINLFPGTLQDAMIYRLEISKKFTEAIDKLPRNTSKFFPFADPGDSYTKWALQSCQHIERKILKKNNLVFIDINEVVSRYLVQVLKNRFHVFHKMFFDSKTRKEFNDVFPDEIMFCAPVIKGKYERMESFKLRGSSLVSKTRKIDLGNSKILIRELEEGRLCPALLPGFLALAFLNQFKCFGSFAQVEYLPAYQEKLAQLSFMKKFKMENVPTSNLTTGVFPGAKDVYPADIVLDNKKFNPSSNMLFGELLYDMESTLLSSYFTGSERKK